MNSKKAKKDKYENPIGDGSYHAMYDVFEFPEYPEISFRVDKSNTTESVYVTYKNSKNNESAVVRYSNHTSNAVKFGDQINGNSLNAKLDVLSALKIMQKKFVPSISLMIHKRQVKKTEISNYKEADKTIQEIYKMGLGADISMYKGMLAKGSNWLIEGERIERYETGFGDYEYSNNPNYNK